MRLTRAGYCSLVDKEVLFMTKNQKIEWLASGLILLSFFVLMCVAVRNLDLFGTKETDPLVIVAIIAFFSVCGVFIINYLIKTVLSLVRKDNGTVIPLIWISAPVSCGLISIFFANGMWSFNEEFVFFNILSVVFGVFEIIIVNIYYAVFYGKDRIMIFSQILFNAAVWGYVFLNNIDSYIRLVHNVYLAMFIPAVFAGYIEFAIRSRLSENK